MNPKNLLSRYSNSNFSLITLIIFLGIPLLVGSLSASLSGDSMTSFQELTKPPLSPPGWLFPIVWTILFLLMGLASYLVFIEDKNSPALQVYGLQLIVNFFWSIFFFAGEWYFLSFLWLVFLWILILITIKSFYKVDKTAALLLVPYWLWVTFAGYLNLAILFLN